MNYLLESKFELQLPDGGTIASDRGPDLRAAAGFLCHMANRITGQDYLSSAKISLATISSEPLTIRDDNLGEFTIPGFAIPIDLPVLISHQALLVFKPVVLIAMTAPTIAVRISDLFPERVRHIEIDTPCIHLTATHPEGDRVHFPCAHMTAAHPGGHRSPETIPCVHIVPQHPGGHTERLHCVHPTVMHPGGDKIWTPCLHIGKLHGSHRGPGGIRVPCLHIGPKHSGGHETTVPCVHLTVAHPEGHEVSVPCTHMGPEHPGGDPGPVLPCTHLVQAHPDGHNIPCVHLGPQHSSDPGPVLPCLHLVQAHPEGHDNLVPCVHITAAHPGGHEPSIEIDLEDLDFDISLGENISSYVRHILLVSMAFEPNVNSIEMLAAAKGSNHLWSMLLRSAVLGGDVGTLVADVVIANELKAIHEACPHEGPRSGPGGQWVKDNRWIRCTDLESGDPGRKYNGLDFLSLEVLMRLEGLFR